MKTLLFSVSALLLLSCGTKKISGDGTGQTIEMKPEKKLEATLGKAEMNSHPVTISNAVIEGNKLILNVSYPGGCQEHFFKLVGSEMVAKSMPPQRGVRLVHTGEQDLCKALILKKLEFDISNLAYKKERGDVIMLNLEGWNEPLKYTFE